MKLEDEIKSKFRDDYHKALVNLYYTNNVIGEQFFKMLKEFGLAVPQYNVLRILREEAPDSVSIGFIKERMLERNSDASRIVDRLYKKKLVERKENKSDRRQKKCLLPKKGLTYLEKWWVAKSRKMQISPN